jgi:hypothetical protein
MHNIYINSIYSSRQVVEVKNFSVCYWFHLRKVPCRSRAKKNGSDSELGKGNNNNNKTQLDRELGLLSLLKSK